MGLALGAGALSVTRVFPIVTSAPQMVVVSGEAKTKVKNQVASFSAGVNVIKDKKEDATAELNTKMNSIVAAAKNFGIKDEDIKTQSLNYYQTPEGSGTYAGGPKPGSWNVSSNIEITLRDVSKATELAGLLAGSGANNVYGPNFMLDDTAESEKGLVDEAMKNAREKAESLAKSGGRSLGKVLNISEGGGNMGYPLMMGAKAEGMGGGGAPMEPGSGTVYKTVTVSYELK